MIHDVKCSTCKQIVARVELVGDNVDLKILKFHCGKCNFTVDDVTWIDSLKHSQQDRDKTFATMVNMNKC